MFVAQSDSVITAGNLLVTLRGIHAIKGVALFIVRRLVADSIPWDVVVSYEAGDLASHELAEELRAFEAVCPPFADRVYTARGEREDREYFAAVSGR